MPQLPRTLKLTTAVATLLTRAGFKCTVTGEGNQISIEDQIIMVTPALAKIVNGEVVPYDPKLGGFVYSASAAAAEHQRAMRNKHKKTYRSKETPEHREARLAAMREARAAKLASMTPAEIEAERVKRAEYMRQYRARPKLEPSTITAAPAIETDEPEDYEAPEDDPRFGNLTE